MLSRMNRCFRCDAVFFKAAEIFTADLSLLTLGNAGIISICCLHICMYPNDVPYFVYGICNEAKKNYATAWEASIMRLNK